MVRFGESLDASLVNLSGITLTLLGADGVPGGGDDTPVSLAAVEVHMLGQNLSIFPLGTLDPGNYRLTLDPSIIADQAGNHLADSFSLSFAVRPDSDNLPPAVIGTNPAADQAVASAPSIVVLFGEPLDTALVNLSGITLTLLGADGVPGGGDDTLVSLASVETRSRDTSLTITPRDVLDPGRYRLTLDPSIIADRAGNHPAGPYSLPFTIRTPPVPQIVQFIETIPPARTNFTATVTFPQFDPSLGTLTGITFTLVGHVEGTFQFESLDVVPAPVTGLLRARIALNRPDNSLLMAVLPTVTTMDLVTAFDGDIDFGGTSGRTLTGLAAVATDSLTAPPPASDLALFTGTGTISLPVVATGQSTASGSGSLAIGFTTSAAAVVTVTYSYLPDEDLPSSLSGSVFVDADNDGVFQAGEAGIGGVAVFLTGTDDRGAPYSASSVTAPGGSYFFAGLRPGTYTISEPQPPGFLDGLDTQGTPGTGITGNDTFSGIVLLAGVNGVGNNFGELVPASLAPFVDAAVNIDGMRLMTSNGAPSGPVMVTTRAGDASPSVTHQVIGHPLHSWGESRDHRTPAGPAIFVGAVARRKDHSPARIFPASVDTQATPSPRQRIGHSDRASAPVLDAQAIDSLLSRQDATGDRNTLVGRVRGRKIRRTI